MMQKMKKFSAIAGFCCLIIAAVLITSAVGLTGSLAFVSEVFAAAGRIFTAEMSARKIAAIVIAVLVAAAFIWLLIVCIKKKKGALVPFTMVIFAAMAIATLWRYQGVLGLLEGKVYDATNKLMAASITKVHGVFAFAAWVLTMLFFLCYTVLAFTTIKQDLLAAPAKEEAPAEEAAEEEAPAEEAAEEEKPAEEAAEEEKCCCEEDPTKYAAQADVVLGETVEFVSGEHTLKAKILELDGEEFKRSMLITKKMVIDYVLAMSGEAHPVATTHPEKKSERSPEGLYIEHSNMELIYGKDGALSVLMRLPADVANKLKETHEIEDSNFAGTKDYYKVNFAKSWETEEELHEILEASYAYVLSKYFKVEDGKYVELDAEEVEPEEEPVVEEDPTKYAAQSDVELGKEVEFVSGEHTLTATIIKLDGEELAKEEEPEEEEEEEAPVVAPVELPEGSAFPSIKTKSFEKKFKDADKELRQKYSELKNALLSHKKVHGRVSASADSYRLGRKLLAKITFAGKHIKLSLALDPKAYEQNRYHQVDVSEKKKFAEVPFQMKIQSGLSVRNAIRLINEMCDNEGAPADPKYDVVDYSTRNGLEK